MIRIISVVLMRLTMCPQPRNFIYILHSSSTFTICPLPSPSSGHSVPGGEIIIHTGQNIWVGTTLIVSASSQLKTVIDLRTSISFLVETKFYCRAIRKYRCLNCRTLQNISLETETEWRAIWTKTYKHPAHKIYISFVTWPLMIH